MINSGCFCIYWGKRGRAAVFASPRLAGLLLFLRDFFRDGTFPPFCLASLRPIAIACFRLFTLRPELLFKVPFFRRCIADLTRFCADLPYLAIESPWRVKHMPCR